MASFRVSFNDVEKKSKGKGSAQSTSQNMNNTREKTILSDVTDEHRPSTKPAPYRSERKLQINNTEEKYNR